MFDKLDGLDLEELKEFYLALWCSLSDAGNSVSRNKAGYESELVRRALSSIMKLLKSVWSAHNSPVEYDAKKLGHRFREQIVKVPEIEALLEESVKRAFQRDKFRLSREQWFPCPCCGFHSFVSQPGSFHICRICFWEDDFVQLLDPWFEGGANSVSLVTAQKNYQAIGASEERLLEFVRPIHKVDIKHVKWRLVAEKDRENVSCLRDLEDQDGPKAWYYWER